MIEFRAKLCSCRIEFDSSTNKIKNILSQCTEHSCKKGDDWIGSDLQMSHADPPTILQSFGQAYVDKYNNYMKTATVKLDPANYSNVAQSQNTTLG